MVTTIGREMEDMDVHFITIVLATMCTFTLWRAALRPSPPVAAIKTH